VCSSDLDLTVTRVVSGVAAQFRRHLRRDVGG